MQRIKTRKDFHCFVCGSQLEEIGLGWIQCKSEQCGEVFLAFKESHGLQCLALQQTPFTPLFNG